MAIKLVPIKPKGKLFDIGRIERAVRDAMAEAGEEAIALYEQCTSTWERQPVFEAVVVSDGVIVGTDDPIFQYVDEGTAPHPILPKAGRVLRFRGGYSAKTSPGQLGSGGGGASGGVVFTRRVNHPGTKARDFTALVQQQMQNVLPVIIAQHLGDALGD